MVVAHVVAKRQVDPYEGFAATAAELDIRLAACSLGLTQKMSQRLNQTVGGQMRECGHAS